MPKVSLPIRYVSPNSFGIKGLSGASVARQFPPGVKVRLNCGIDGFAIGAVQISRFESKNGWTIVTLDMSSGNVTSRLESAYRGNDSRETLVRHSHTGPEDGGDLSKDTLLGLLGQINISQRPQWFIPIGVDAIAGPYQQYPVLFGVFIVEGSLYMDVGTQLIV